MNYKYHIIDYFILKRNSNNKIFICLYDSKRKLFG